VSKDMDLELHGKNLRDVSRRDVLATAAKLGAAGALGAAALGADPLQALAAAAGAHPKYKFTFVNHVTTNPFFTPTISGMTDAAKLLGCATPQWAGSETSNVSQMVSAINTAIAAKVDGIATTVIDPAAFDTPIANAVAAGIPVVSYNADNNPNNKRLAYIGQDLFASGQAMGRMILSLVKPGGSIVIFIATPGSGNIQPRVDGAVAVIGKTLKVKVVASGAALTQEQATIESYYLGHKDLNGMFAVDGGSSWYCGATSTKYGLKKKGMAIGGFDLQPGTLAAITSGDMDFTIDQQPYQQGFLPIVYLALYKLSGGLQSPSTSNTGLKFVTPANVAGYNVASYFEGAPKTSSPW
jgi:simple sugar transport system substrate-binding protein